LALLYPGVARANAIRSPAGGVRLVVSAAQGNALTDHTPLREFMQARRDSSVALEIVEPDPVDLSISATLELDPAFNQQVVEEAVRAALHGQADEAGLFTFAARELGQAAHLSEVYARIQAIPGVSFVHLEMFRIDDIDKSQAIHDVIVVESHQWLRLDPAQLTLTTSYSTEEA
jgi:hypothetical protein